MVKDSCARITHKENWEAYFALSFVSPEIASSAQPGQFIMVRVSQGTHPLLRRPFSIFSARQDTIAIFFQKAGLGTSLLSQKREGESLDILGPLGKGFSVPATEGKGRVALVGGGRGVAPLYFLAERLRPLNIEAKLYYGAKSSSDLPLKARMEEENIILCCSTEDGSAGFKGLITEAFESDIGSARPERIYACGPELMLRRIAQTAQAHNIPAELSLESIMGCGFGACWGCVKKIKREDGINWRKLCEEGPVLPAGEIIWE